MSKELGLPQHVLRFWENKFNHIRPMKRGGGRRFYRPEDLELLRRIQHLLYDEGYTIKGVQKVLKEKTKKTNEVKSYLSQKDRTLLNSAIIELEDIKQILS